MIWVYIIGYIGIAVIALAFIVTRMRAEQRRINTRTRPVTIKVPERALYLMHGRDTVEEELDDWGYEGPRLQNCIGIHQTYGALINVFFVDKAAAQKAQEQTGWEWYEENALVMRWDGPFVVANGKYYGDWGIMIED